MIILPYDVSTLPVLIYYHCACNVTNCVMLLLTLHIWKHHTALYSQAVECKTQPNSVNVIHYHTCSVCANLYFNSSSYSLALHLGLNESFSKKCDNQNSKQHLCTLLEKQKKISKINRTFIQNVCIPFLQSHKCCIQRPCYSHLWLILSLSSLNTIGALSACSKTRFIRSVTTRIYYPINVFSANKAD